MCKIFSIFFLLYFCLFRLMLYCIVVVLRTLDPSFPPSHTHSPTHSAPLTLFIYLSSTPLPPSLLSSISVHSTLIHSSPQPVPPTLTCNPSLPPSQSLTHPFPPSCILTLANLRSLAWLALGIVGKLATNPSHWPGAVGSGCTHSLCRCLHL